MVSKEIFFILILIPLSNLKFLEDQDESFQKELEENLNSNTIFQNQASLELKDDKEYYNFNVMSFNVRVANDVLRFGKNGTIVARAPIVLKYISKYAPDTIGFQEVSTSSEGKENWYKLLQEGLNSTYDSICMGRDGNMNSESTPIFYNREKFELIESGTKWLSPTPDVPGSKFNDTTEHPTDGYPRTLIYVVLKDKETGKSYMHINTHLDYMYSINRISQVGVIENFVMNYTEKYPIIITGDFNSVNTINAKKKGDAIPYLLEHGFISSTSDVINADPHRTFPVANYQNGVKSKCSNRGHHANLVTLDVQPDCNIGCDLESGQIIDFCLKADNGRTTFTEYKVLYDFDQDGEIASDHYALYLTGTFSYEKPNPDSSNILSLNILIYLLSLIFIF